MSRGLSLNLSQSLSHIVRPTQQAPDLDKLVVDDDDGALDPHKNAEYAIDELLGNPALAPGENKKLDEAQAALRADLDSLGVWMEKLAQEAGQPEKQLDILCDMVLEGAPKHLNTSQVRDGLKAAFRKSMLHLGKEDAAKLDKVFMAKVEEQLAKAKGNPKIHATWLQHLATNGVAWLAGGFLGFGLVALIMKILVHGTPLGANASHFVIFAGPWIALVIDFLLGWIKTNVFGGAGYIAADTGAHLEYSTAQANIDSLKQYLEGLKSNPTKDETEIARVEKEIAGEELKVQAFVVDVMRREFGKPLQLKTEEERDDVPARWKSDVHVGEGRVVMAPGSKTEPLFKIVSEPGAEDVRVQWFDDAKTVTSLLKDPVPENCRKAFQKLKDEFVDAVRDRAWADDATFLIFGVPFLWNMAGPHLLFSMGNSTLARVGDGGLMVASSVIGTAMLLALQHYVRKFLTGVPTEWAGNTELRDAKYDVARIGLQHVKAQLEVLRPARSRCEDELAAAVATYAALKAREGSDNPPSADELKLAAETVSQYRQMRGRLRSHCKALVKRQQALETEKAKAGSSLRALWEGGFKANWTKLMDNPSRMVGRVLGFTACYIAYGELWTLMLGASLKPVPSQIPVPGNQTLAGNGTEPATMPAPYDFHSALPYMGANGTGGIFMAAIFTFRNRITSGFEYYSKQVWGAVKAAQARNADNSGLVAPDRLKDSWKDSEFGSGLDSIAAKRTRMVVTVLGRIPADILVKGGLELNAALEGVRQLDLPIIGKKPWENHEVWLLRSTMGLMLEEWDVVGKEFGSMAGQMKKAFENVRNWCSAELQAEESASDEDSGVDDDIEVIPSDDDDIQVIPSDDEDAEVEDSTSSHEQFNAFRAMRGDHPRVPEATWTNIGRLISGLTPDEWESILPNYDRMDGIARAWTAGQVRDIQRHARSMIDRMPENPSQQEQELIPVLRAIGNWADHWFMRNDESSSDSDDGQSH